MKRIEDDVNLQIYFPIGNDDSKVSNKCPFPETILCLYSWGKNSFCLAGSSVLGGLAGLSLARNSMPLGQS